MSKHLTVNRFRLLIAAFAIVFLLPETVSGQWLPGNKEAVDSLFSTMLRNSSNKKGADSLGSPGCALAVVRKGRIVYSQGYGMADLEQGVPITPGSVFYAGSVSKQFVASCILLLEEQGALDLDADVRSIIPDIPDYGNTITLRHLIHHSSGLRDYLELWDLSGRDNLDYIPDHAVLDMISRQRALNFPPGDQYSYSNSGYFLLKEVVEKVSGMSLSEFADKNIFEPLGMNNSHFHDDFHHLIPNRAQAYQQDENGGVENLPMRFDLVGSGGLYTTVEDLFHWDQNFYNNRIGEGSQAFLDTLLTPGKLNDGSSLGYAFAMNHDVYRGYATVSHTGSMGGYRAYYLRIPESEFSVILLGNFAEFQPVPYAKKIVDIVLRPTRPAGNYEEPSSKPEVSQVTWTDEQLSEMPGIYYCAELNTMALIRRHPKELILQIGYDEPLHLKRWLKENPNNEFIIKYPTGDSFLFGASGIKNILFERFDPDED